MLRAVEAQSAPIPEEITSELGWTFISFDARSREQPWPLTILSLAEVPGLRSDISRSSA